MNLESSIANGTGNQQKDIEDMVHVLDELEKNRTNLSKGFFDRKITKTSLQKTGEVGSSAYEKALNEKIEKN